MTTTPQDAGAADVTTPDRGTGHHIGEINTLDWQIRHYAESLAEHRDRYASYADMCYHTGDRLNGNYHSAQAETYRHALAALHIWTGGAYGERNTQ